jgi:hypothetical protein
VVVTLRSASVMTRDTGGVANAVRKQNLRDAIANAIAENVKAYDVADVCVHLLGLDPPASAYDDPMSSKRVYVRSRLIHKSVEELEVIARAVIDEYGDDDLEQLVAQLGMTGVAGELKTLSSLRTDLSHALSCEMPSTTSSRLRKTLGTASYTTNRSPEQV